MASQVANLLMCASENGDLHKALTEIKEPRTTCLFCRSERVSEGSTLGVGSLPKRRGDHNLQLGA